MRRRRRPWRFVVALLLLVTAVGGAVWFLWIAGDEADDREIVVFRADTTPYRVAPDTTDVSEIPNTGILVLETTADSDEGEGHEVLMPPPEEPLVLDVVAPEADDEVVDVTEAPLEAADEEAEVTPIFDADQVTAMVDEALDETPRLLPPLPEDKPRAPAVDWAPGAEVADDDAGTSSLSFSDVAAALGGEVADDEQADPGTLFGVRVASLSSGEAATATWDRLHREHNDLFGGMEAIITRITVDGNHFYRLTIGEFEAKQEAEGLCAAVVERALECLVVTY